MGLFSSILPVAGGIAGGIFGGPAGASIGSSIGGGIGGIFNQRSQQKGIRRNAAQAQQYLDKIQGVGKQYFDPYIQPGLDASGRVDQEYSKMLDDPTGFVNAIMESYQPSKGYQFKEDRLRRGAANTAAAGGFSGTQYDIDNQSALVNSLLSDDMQQYLANILGVHGAGIAGKEGIAGRGFDASTGLADYLGSALGAQSGLSYHAGRDANQSRGAFNDALLNLGGDIAGQISQRYFPSKPKTNVPGASFMR